MAWSSGLCGCFEDCSVCCMTTFFPCVTFGRVAEHADNDETSCCVAGCLYCLFRTIGVQCLYTCVYRGKLRQKYNLPEEPCADCCVHWLCEVCALTQEAREIKIRTANTSIGLAAPRAVEGMVR